MCMPRHDLGNEQQMQTQAIACWECNLDVVLEEMSTNMDIWSRSIGFKYLEGEKEQGN